ncbi:translation initiation factor 2B subunit I family (IF-2BI) [Archaeoglobus sulfaticallidus PM70-1]|uniref:Putative methylthioribose-1-phosphate isomerase n=1 Tax=Archaeoglobus sulfaticallidus PM70-1 TaxID=387631 RepID=N0BH50_9EURY|nr:S-methyl-5-thioribose-1-phosphate isomerase [Archaeoglobus sulfaticallidus]AGK61617.1 translation initiation factor 2B subunit I family (IF-2BI) [Archaeoglobus sulfaticallidus PM70-1]
MRTIYWENCIKMIDQTKLPDELEILEIRNVDDLVSAIKRLSIRGAPALEAAGGYGVALACIEREFDSFEDFLKYVSERASSLANARPTAVNLSVGVERVLRKVKAASSIEEARKLAVQEAEKIAEEDVFRNRLMGSFGAKLIEDGDSILTICNTGSLATVEWGTALGVIRSAKLEGKNIRVFACETRPLNQGSRLTTWELINDGIDVTLITDSMAGIVMQKGMVDKVIVGADRIVSDGVFNKIGTYTLAVLAKEHGIPFFVAAPLTTFDWEKKMDDVVIEERDADELRYCHVKCKNCRIAPENVKVYNPAFDSTPLSYVSALITEKGVIFPPYDESVPKVLKSKEFINR